MLDLPSLGPEIAKRRKAMGLRQSDLADKARVSRATVEALENGRLGELGFAKLMRILAAVGLGLTLGDATKRRPTLEELILEDESDQALGRRN